MTATRREIAPARAVRFVYRAVRADGAIERGTLAANDREAVVEALAERGLWALEVRPRRSLRASMHGGRRTMPLAQLGLGLRILADLLESGLPLSRALAALADLSPTAWQIALPSVRESVREGKTLAAALAAAPVSIPSLVIGVVQAGEAGSGLASAVRRAADILEEAEATRAALRGALAYPIVLATAGTASLCLLVGVVLPRFAAILADLGQSLPPTTRMVLGTAAIIRAALLPMSIASVLAIYGWYLWTNTLTGQRRWHAFLLGLPVLGGLRRSAATARACSALGGLLASGVPMRSALSSAAHATGDAALETRLLEARDAVMHGERLSHALAVRDASTMTVARLVRAGEESGRLASMLEHAARLERENAIGRTRLLVRLLEPALILAFGGIVAVVAAALLQALYSVRPGT